MSKPKISELERQWETGACFRSELQALLRLARAAKEVNDNVNMHFAELSAALDAFDWDDNANNQ